MNNLFSIEVRGYSVKIKVTSYQLPISAYTSGHPDNAYPADDGYVDWYPATDRDLLNELILLDTKEHSNIEKQLFKKLKEKEYELNAT